MSTIRVMVAAAAASLLLSACEIAVPALLAGSAVALEMVSDACNADPSVCNGKE